MVAGGFVKHRFEDGSHYTVFMPHKYDAAVPHPVVLFLHGAGEVGYDGRAPLRVGLGPAIRRHEESFPFLVIFPQSQHGSWRAGTPDAERALAILDEVERNYHVDPARVHLTGISMGGFGTWSLAAYLPKRWAAIVPVCGGGNPRAAAAFRDIPCWAFHGGEDEVIPVEGTRAMIEALRAAGGKPRYTEFAGIGHNSWDSAYAMPELYWWLAAQSRRTSVGL